MLPTETVTLHTARLALRPLREDDVASLFTLYSDPEFMRYWSFPVMTRLEQAAEYLDRLMRRGNPPAHVNWAIQLSQGDQSGELIGTCTLFHVVASCRRAEIGFGVHRSHWGQGYAAEATQAVVDYGFDTLGFNRLEADIDPRNTGSARTLERAGFVREGLLRERWIVGDEVSDSALYGLIRSDWAARQQVAHRKPGMCPAD
ncbi:GNAT family N-acetyltransferase [Trinickia fusca]|uniref:N-acetyltransferase n=1 Tax=Trinickia fusca TaxID=2419777 RepID=A0A494X7J9_9BURK|nr:GNAT family N-acetyltransferase [Trinickia fusca]RKP46430.1 N-acetyltransferase [Trinickia fusca]